MSVYRSPGCDAHRHDAPEFIADQECPSGRLLQRRRNRVLQGFEINNGLILDLEVDMRPETRTAAAAIGAAIINRRKVTSVYSYSGSGFVSIDAELIGNQIKAYDYSSSCHIEGGLPSSVYHYGNGSFLEFKMSGNKIDGYDYGTSSFFEITVLGENVELYDYGDGNFYSFSVSM